VRAKLGLEPFGSNGKTSAAVGVTPSNGKKKARGTYKCAYEYVDEEEGFLFQTVRFENPKNFSQRRWARPDDDPKDISGEWVWNLNGVRRVLYRLPELIEGISVGHPVYIAEGEKAVEALRKLGVIATCSPLGAGKWREEYNQHLAGADVIV